MTGNLLIDMDCFRWEDLDIDLTEAIENMFQAHDLARSYGDNIFGHPKLWDIELSWGYFHEIFSWDESERIEKTPWLGDITLSVLTQIFSYSTTDCGCENLADMDIEFEGEFNGLLGCSATTNLDSYIKNDASWYKWHRQYFINNPTDRISFVDNLSPFFPNLYFNKNSVTTGLNGLHTSHKEIMQTILHHLSALNDVFFPKFQAEPHLGGDGVCDYLEDFYRPNEIQIRASRDRNDCIDITFDFKDESTSETKRLYCDLHTKFRDYFELPIPNFEAKGNRVYFHQPIDGFLDGKLLIGRIGKHATCG